MDPNRCGPQADPPGSGTGDTVKRDSAANRGGSRRRIQLLLKDEAGIQTISLTQGEIVTFGGSLAADYTFSDPELAAIHCRLVMAPSGCYLECMSSNAQVKHNGITKSRCRLKHGDEVEFGNVQIKAIDPDKAPTPSLSSGSEHHTTVDSNTRPENLDIVPIESGAIESPSSAEMEILPALTDDLSPEALNPIDDSSIQRQDASLSYDLFSESLNLIDDIRIERQEASLSDDVFPESLHQTLSADMVEVPFQEPEILDEATRPAAESSVESIQPEEVIAPQVLAVETSKHEPPRSAFENLDWEVWPDGLIRSTRCDSKALNLLGLTDSANVYFLRNSELTSCSWPEFVRGEKATFGEVVFVSHEQRSELAPFLERKWRAKMSRQGAILGALQLPVAKAKREFFERCQLVMIIGQDGDFDIFAGIL